MMQREVKETMMVHRHTDDPRTLGGAVQWHCLTVSDH